MQEHYPHLDSDMLLDTFVLYTKLFHKPFSKEALIQGLPLDGSNQILTSKDPNRLLSRIAKRAGLESTLIHRSLDDMLTLHLPVILVLKNGHACILSEFNSDKTQAKVIYAEHGEGLEEWVTLQELEKEYLGYAFLLKKRFSYENITSKTLEHKYKHWFWDTIKLSAPIYKDVLIASLLINLFVLATPLFTMNVYDRVIPNNAQETLLVFTLGVVFVYILDFFLKTTRAYLLELAGKKSDIILSSIIFEKVLDLKMGEFPPSVGSFASNLKDFEAVRSFFTTATMTALIDIPFAIIFLAVIYYIGGVLVLVPLVTMGLIFGYAMFIRKPLQESIEASHEAGARKNSVLIETLQNIETVKATRMAGKQQWRWEEATGEIAQKNLKSRMLSASIPTVTNLLVQLNTVFVVVLGVYLIKEFELTMGGLIAVVILTSRTIAPMGQAAALISNYADAKSSYDILNDIILKEAERPEGKEFVQRPEFKGKIEFKNVSFAYPGTDFYVLKDVSFVINPGEKVAIIGRIGSGKSTIAKLLLKLYEPTQGTILLDDIDIAQIDPAQLRKYINYVPQDIHLFRGTLKENIVTSQQHPSMESILDAAKVSGVEEFVKTHPLGFDMPIGERGSGLSGGQRQSVGIARALVQKGSVVVMDEPTNAMDQTSENNLMVNLSKELQRQTLVLITQKLTLLTMVDRVLVVHNATLMLDGDKETVMKSLGANSGKENK